MVPYKGCWDLPGVNDPVNLVNRYLRSPVSENHLSPVTEYHPAPLPVPQPSKETAPQPNTEPAPQATTENDDIALDEEVEKMPWVWKRLFDRQTLCLLMKISCFSKTLHKRLTEAGLQQQLPENHTLVALFREVLAISHPLQPGAVKNYTATASRVLNYINSVITRRESAPPSHWSKLLVEPDVIIEYLNK